MRLLGRRKGFPLRIGNVATASKIYKVVNEGSDNAFIFCPLLDSHPTNSIENNLVQLWPHLSPEGLLSRPARAAGWSFPQTPTRLRRPPNLPSTTSQPVISTTAPPKTLMGTALGRRNLRLRGPFTRFLPALEMTRGSCLPF